MSSSRDQILMAVRNNLATSARFDHDHETHGTAALPKDDEKERVAPAQDIISTFCERLRSVNGQAMVAANENEATGALQKIISELSPRTIALSDSRLVRSLVDSLKIEAEILTNASAAKLFDCDVGITGAQSAIAETGTLVLGSEKEFNRRTSLIPETHMCILAANTIRRSMSEVLDWMAADLNPTFTFITGPSRTSDIELTLAIGVHGPRRLYVIVLDRDQGQTKGPGALNSLNL